MGKSPQKGRKRSSSTVEDEEEQESRSAATRRSPRKRTRPTPPPPPSPSKTASPKKGKAGGASPNKAKKQASTATGDAQLRTSQSAKREVFIVPTSFGGKVDKPDKSLDFVHLRHPKTGSKATYLLAKDNSDVCEVLSYEDSPSSWFIGNTVQESGKIIVCTAIDPLFLVVPYLQKNHKYMLLDQLLMDDEFPSCVRLALCLKVCDNINKIANSKQCGNELAYRFDQEKVYEWLQNKVDRLVVTLEKKKVHVGEGARAATYVPSNKEQTADQKSYTLYAAGMISEYLPEGLSTSFLKHLGFDSKATEGVKPPKLKKNNSAKETVEPTENYATAATGAKKPTKPTKLTPGQRALSKVDKTGMKNISSFFAKK